MIKTNRESYVNYQVAPIPCSILLNFNWCRALIQSLCFSRASCSTCLWSDVMKMTNIKLNVSQHEKNSLTNVLTAKLCKVNYKCCSKNHQFSAITDNHKNMLHFQSSKAQIIWRWNGHELLWRMRDNPKSYFSWDGSHQRATWRQYLWENPQICNIFSLYTANILWPSSYLLMHCCYKRKSSACKWLTEMYFFSIL